MSISSFFGDFFPSNDKGYSPGPSSNNYVAGLIYKKREEYLNQLALLENMRAKDNPESLSQNKETDFLKVKTDQSNTEEGTTSNETFSKNKKMADLYEARISFTKYKIDELEKLLKPYENAKKDIV